jgi:hypothetical protein
MKASLSIRALLLGLACLGVATSVNTTESSKLFDIHSSANTSEEASQHIDIEMTSTILSYLYTSPVALTRLKLIVYRNSQFTIDCVDCSIVGDLSFSGGCNDTPANGCIEQWAPDANFSMLPFDFSEYWLGMVVDNFKIHIELNINLTPSQPTNEIDIPLLGQSGLDFPFMVSCALSGPSSSLLSL